MIRSFLCYAMYLVSLSSAIVCGLFWYIWSSKKSQIQKSGGFKSGECGYHSGTRRQLINRPAKRRFSHSLVMLAVWGFAPSCLNYCFSLHATTGTKCPPELVKNNKVTPFVDRNCLSKIILKPKQSYYSIITTIQFSARKTTFYDKSSF